MRIKNRYYRNRHVRNKTWNRAKKFVGGEFAYKARFPYWFHGRLYCTAEEQLKDHQEWINNWWVRGLTSGQKRGHYHAPKWYRQEIERPERHAVKQILHKMLEDVENVDDVDIPTFKHQADWDWF